MGYIRSVESDGATSESVDWARLTHMFPFAGVTAEMAAAASQARRERVEMVTRVSSAMFFGDDGK